MAGGLEAKIKRKLGSAQEFNILLREENLAGFTVFASFVSILATSVGSGVASPESQEASWNPMDVRAKSLVSNNQNVSLASTLNKFRKTTSESSMEPLSDHMMSIGDT